MVATEPRTEHNLDGYGAPPIEWSRVRETIEEGVTQGPGAGGPNRHTYWLATTLPDGSPHVRPVGVFYTDGRFYFTAGPGTRKAKNFEHNPHVVLSVATEPFDLAIHGTARRVTDEDGLEQVAKVASAQGWPAEPRDGGIWAEYSAPSAGPPPWYVYEVTPEKVFAFGTAEPYGAERFEF
ncbi:MAG: pyridoxamine 5'-phosphate oxidase family protein [Acidimicrobiia bacterium]